MKQMFIIHLEQAKSIIKKKTIYMERYKGTEQDETRKVACASANLGSLEWEF